HVALPTPRLPGEGLTPGRREGVVAGPPALLGDAPGALHPPPLLHPAKGRVEGAVLHLEGLAGGAPDPLQDLEAVYRSPRRDGLEGEELQGALEHAEGFVQEAALRAWTKHLRSR